MTIQAEIRQALREGASPLFLIGLMELYKDNREPLIRVINEVGTRAYMKREEEIENAAHEKWQTDASSFRVGLRAINRGGRGPRLLQRG